MQGIYENEFGRNGGFVDPDTARAEGSRVIWGGSFELIMSDRYIPVDGMYSLPHSSDFGHVAGDD